MKHIPLSTTRFAVVDDQDYDALTAMGRWHANSSGYAVLYTHYPDGTRRVLYLHRVVMQRVLGHPVGSMQVDHINADRLDCRRDNLRLVTASENQAAKSNQVNSTSGHKGVTWRNRAYDVRLRYYHHRLHLGRYSDFDLAVAIYGFAHRILWGEFSSEVASDVPLPEDVQVKVEEQVSLFLRTFLPHVRFEDFLANRKERGIH